MCTFTQRIEFVYTHWKSKKHCELDFNEDAAQMDNEKF